MYPIRLACADIKKTWKAVVRLACNCHLQAILTSSKTWKMSWNMYPIRLACADIKRTWKAVVRLACSCHLQAILILTYPWEKGSVCPLKLRYDRRPYLINKCSTNTIVICILHAPAQITSDTLRLSWSSEHYAHCIVSRQVNPGSTCMESIQLIRHWYSPETML